MIDFQNWFGAQLSQITIHDAYLFRALAPLLDFGANPLAVLTPNFMVRASLGLMRHLVARPKLPGATALPLLQAQVPDHKALAMLPSATR